MKTAINPCTWAGHAKHTGATFAWQQFVREAAKAGYAGVEFGGTPLPPKEARASAVAICARRAISDLCKNSFCALLPLGKKLL